MTQPRHYGDGAPPQAEHREPETKASKLGRLAGRAVADFRNRMRQP